MRFSSDGKYLIAGSNQKRFILYENESTSPTNTSQKNNFLKI